MTQQQSIIKRSRQQSNRNRPFYFLATVICSSIVSSWLLVGSCDALGTNSVATKTNTNLKIKLVDLSDKTEIAALQECRRTAFGTDKQKWLDSERNFCAAQSVLDQKNLCAVAYLLEENSGELVGSADLQPEQSGANAILNVFVRPDQRGKGIGRKLMVEGIERVLVPLLKGPNVKIDKASNAESVVLSLNVYTQNTAAVELYLKLGYEPSSPIHAGVLGLANAFKSNLLVSMSKTIPL